MCKDSAENQLNGTRDVKKKTKRQLLAISMSLLMLSVEIIFNGIVRENEIKNSV